MSERKVKHHAAVLAHYLSQADLESALEQARYDWKNNDFQRDYLETIMVIKRALELNS